MAAGVSNDVLYLGRASNGAAYNRVLNATRTRVGVGSWAPAAALDVLCDPADATMILARGTGGPFYVSREGLVGVGTTAPTAVAHVFSNASAGAALRVSSAAVAPALDVSFGGFVGIGTGARSAYGLTVVGGVSASNADVATVRTDALTPLVADFTTTGPLRVVGSSSNLSPDPLGAAIGVQVKESVVATSYLSVSDARTKENIAAADALADLATVLAIEPKHFNLKGSARGCRGFLAQDVEAVVADAVHVGPGQVLGAPVPDFRYLDAQQLVPILWNAVRALAGRSNA